MKNVLDYNVKSNKMYSFDSLLVIIIIIITLIQMSFAEEKKNLLYTCIKRIDAVRNTCVL